jgi:uncharacterized coiled-coil protein SlyX
MFNIFKQIKQLKMKKEELELEQSKMVEAINRLNAANKEQSNIISQLRTELNGATNRVKDLAEQLKMKEAQQKAATQFNDNNRNY